MTTDLAIRENHEEGIIRKVQHKYQISTSKLVVVLSKELTVSLYEIVQKRSNYMQEQLKEVFFLKNTSTPFKSFEIG